MKVAQMEKLNYRLMDSIDGGSLAIPVLVDIAQDKARSR